MFWIVLSYHASYIPGSVTCINALTVSSDSEVSSIWISLVLLAPITEHCPFRYFIHKENKGWPSYMLIGRSQHNRCPTCPAGRQNPVRARWRRSSGTTPAAGSGGADQQVPHRLQGLVCVYLKWLPLCIYQNPKLSPKFQ